MFESFFLAGFDGSTGRDKTGRWFDHVVATGHDRLACEDYAAIADVGLRGAREAVRWPLIDADHGRAYDFRTLDPFIEAAARHRITVIWDLFHYGYPEGLDLLGERFPERFAAYCYATARHISRMYEGPYWFTPVNEPSFLAYAAGERGLFAPWMKGRGAELKVAVVRAALRGIEAIWAACPAARIVNVDPVCYTHAPDGRADLMAAAQHFNDTLIYEAWDMLAGRRCPELGGSPSHLGVVGINYYWTNQWDLCVAPNADGVIPPLTPDDPRRIPLATLVDTVWRRYGCPILITETAEIGDRRAAWIKQLTREAGALRRMGVPLEGICLFPIIAMPEWHDPSCWPEMSLWEPSCRERPYSGRTVHAPMYEALRSALRATSGYCSVNARAY